ncbi:aldo/keto reductase [Kitasatospora aburaviensis]
MEHRHLGRSGLRISEIVFGNLLYPQDSTPDESVLACLRAALDSGITTFDTADIYGMGRSEQLLGRALAGEPRDGVVICTKVFFPTGTGPNGSGLSRKHVREALHASLRRLGTDYVDLYTAHRYDPNTPLEETVSAFADLVRAGKVLYIGVSEWTAPQITEAAALARAMNVQLVYNMPQYSALWREPEAEVIPACEPLGIGQVHTSRSPRGAHREVPAGRPRTGRLRGAAELVGGRARFMRRLLTDEVLERVARLEPVAAEAGLTPSQLAVAWVLHRPNVAGAVIGASQPEQVRENAAASGVKLEPQLMARIDDILGPVVSDGVPMAEPRRSLLTEERTGRGEPSATRPSSSRACAGGPAVPRCGTATGWWASANWWSRAAGSPGPWRTWG